MWDGSAVPLDENLAVAKELLAQCREARVVLEIEVGVVGGEKTYDPRSWGTKAEAGMDARVAEACRNLRSDGSSLGR